ncbi:MAG: DUF4402 domain-containing protein [Parasphingorhabdus sp.]|nr:DUF4402 domain-containing protein [Parasphingorhabdus sp.]
MGVSKQYLCRAGAAVLATIVVLSTAPAVEAAPSNAQAKAVTLRRLSIVNTRALDFGTMISGTTAGTATVNPSTDLRTTTGGVTGAAADSQAAQFFTYGGPLQTLQVNRGPLPVLRRVSGTETMNVSGLTLNGPTLRFLNLAGVLDLRVGGILQVNANQAPGQYTGTFDIIVTYF